MSETTANEVMTEKPAGTSPAFETYDMSLAAYLILRGRKVVTYDRRRNNIRFVLDDTEDEVCKTLHIEFLNSDFKKYDSIVRDLKKIMARKE